MASLIVIGSPCSGPSAPPRAVRSSAWAAAAKAASRSRVTTALTAGLIRSTRAKHSSSSSRLDSSRLRIISASSVAGRRHTWSSVIMLLMSESGTSRKPNRQKQPMPLAFIAYEFVTICTGRPPRSIDREQARPYDGHGRHRLGSLLPVGVTRAFPTPRMCRQRLRRPAPRRPAAPGRRHVAFVAEQPEKRRSETTGDQQCRRR